MTQTKCKLQQQQYVQHWYTKTCSGYAHHMFWVRLNGVSERAGVHGNAASRFGIDFAFMQDLKEHTNINSTLSKKKSRITYMQMCGFSLVCNFLWLANNFLTCHKEGFSIVSLLSCFFLWWLVG